MDVTDDRSAFQARLVLRLQAILESREVTGFIFLMIFLNGVQMGVQSDYTGPGYEAYDAAYAVLEHVFTFVFFVEMGAKLYIYRWTYFTNSFNLLDFATTW